MCFFLVLSRQRLFASHAKSRSTTYPMKGIANGATMFVWSATYPIRRKKHPPMGVIISRDEALLVRSPSHRKASVKMVGNMIASNR